MADLAAFAGGTALVTGAGEGIGAMLARGFAAAGMKVIVQDIREDAAQAVAEEIGASALVFDVSDRDATIAAAESIADQPINLLWLNAGVGVGASLLEGRPNAIEWAFSVNVLGPIWTAQAFLPHLQAAQGARHVGITASSAALRAPEGPWTLYATTKHGTFAVGEALRGELEAHGIGTTILCPGLLNTEIWDGAKARPERFGGVRHMDPNIAETWRAAQDPDVMWPHIVQSIEAGGGYCSCLTDEGNTRSTFADRAAEITSGFHDI